MEDLHPDAFLEFQEAAEYYEVQEPGLGHRFIDSVNNAYKSIQNSPETWPVLED